MKKLFAFLMLATLLAACCKEDAPAPDDMNVPGLPPVTQTGANSLGFLLNGQPWTPEGPNNLSIDYDAGFNNGIVGIAAYRRILGADNDLFVLGIRDSLNTTHAPHAYTITLNSLAGAVYWDRNFCSRRSDDNSNYSNGILQLTKLDRSNRIISGTKSRFSIPCVATLSA